MNSMVGSRSIHRVRKLALRDIRMSASRDLIGSSCYLAEMSSFCTLHCKWTYVDDDDTCSIGVPAICRHVQNTNWGLTCCISKARWKWKAAHLCGDRECSLCLPAHGDTLPSSCDKQAKQYSGRSRYIADSFKACILAIDIFWLIYLLA